MIDRLQRLFRPSSASGRFAEAATRAETEREALLDAVEADPTDHRLLGALTHHTGVMHAQYDLQGYVLKKDHEAAMRIIANIGG